MKKFEYKVVIVPELTVEDKIMELLNLEGQDGWEAVHWFETTPCLGGFPVGSSVNKIILKREI